MRSKPLVLLLSLVFCLCTFLFESAPLAAKEWAAVEGDIEKLNSFWHPQISWWNYKQEHPVGIDVYLKEMEDFYKSEVKWISCEAEPVEIHIVGNVAILYTTYINSFKDPEGNESVISGPWTSVLIKKDDNWLFLSNSWTVK